MTAKSKGSRVWDVEQDEHCEKSPVTCAEKKPAKFVTVCLGEPGQASTGTEISSLSTESLRRSSLLNQNYGISRARERRKVGATPCLPP